MSFSAGILAQAVWLCLNEVWVNGFQDMVLRGKTQKYVDTDQEDNVNGLRLEISQLWFSDKNLIIRCNNLQSPWISGPMQPSGQCWSNVKLLTHTNWSWAAERSHSSEQIFVLTRRHEFDFILRIEGMPTSSSWYSHTDSYAYCAGGAHTHIHTCTLLSDAFTDSRAPRDPVARDRRWCLRLLTCPLSLCHLCSNSQEPKNAPQTWCEMRYPLWKMSAVLCARCHESCSNALPHIRVL